MMLLSLMTTTAAIANPTDVLRKVREYIKTEYKDALIVETERENGKVEVDIVHGKTKKTVIFDELGTWQSTKYEIKKSELPGVIKSSLKNSEYSSYRVEEVEVIETPDKSLYEIELGKLFSDGITIYATPEGEIL